jgi:large subunit ribosomal protein L5
MASLKDKYQSLIPDLGKKFQEKNTLAVPRIIKIVVNMGTKDLLRDKEAKEKLIRDLAAITGQKPKIQPAKKSIAGFGVREGNPIGLTVTLRGDRMYSFLQKLISIVLPRLRDFRGVSRSSFDALGNYTLGLPEYNVFPEIDIINAVKNQGLEITIVLNSRSAEKSLVLLESLGLPFEKK